MNIVTNNAIKALPLSPILGAAVTGCELRKQIGETDAEVLRQMLRKHRLLVFREPALEPEDQIRLVQVFGPVRGSLGDGAEFSLVKAGENDDIQYHTDFSFTRAPLPVVSLYGVEVIGDVAATAFIDMVRAFAELPDATKARIAGKTVFHASDIKSVGQRSKGALGRKDVSANAGSVRGTSHPAILIHPETGEEILFVNQYLSIAFDDMAHQESDQLLAELFAHIYAADHVYTHHWKAGDLIVFDNLALQHRRTKGAVRTLRRVIVSKQPLSDLLS